MIVHHQTGQKAIIEGLKKTVRTERGRVLLCYDDPITKAKGIVELHPSEVQEILGALSRAAAVSEVDIFRVFAGIKP